MEPYEFLGRFSNLMTIVVILAIVIPALDIIIHWKRDKTNKNE
jgi:hypothetical protein